MPDEFNEQTPPEADGPSTPEPDVDASEPQEAPLPAAINASDEDGDGVVEKHEVHVTDASDEPTDTAESVQADADPAPDADEAPADDSNVEPDAAEEDGEGVDTLVPSEDPAYATVGQEAVGEADPEPRFDVSPETAALGEEVVEEKIEAELADVSDLPPSLQAEAAGKTDQAENPSLAGREAEGEVTPLQQRPVEELDGHAAEQNVLVDNGTTIDPGDYHKPGAALPPETEADQNLHPNDGEEQNRLDKYEGFADEDVPEDVLEARQAATADVDGPEGHVPTASETADGTPKPEESASETLQVEVGDFDNDGDQDIREVE